MWHAVKTVCLVVTLATFAFSAKASAQDGSARVYTKEQLQRLYSDYLSDQGFKSRLDGDGDVQFSREGRTYFIAVSEADPEFFRIVLPNIWRIESENERSRVLLAADLSNAKTKTCKVYTVRDTVWVSIEIFVHSPDDFTGVFRRSMSAIDTGVAQFVAKMRE